MRVDHYRKVRRAESSHQSLQDSLQIPEKAAPSAGTPDLEALLSLYQADSKQVSIRIVAKSPAVARGEELLCYSMLANLVKNAIEAEPEGGTVSITVEGAGPRVSVHVHNSGIVSERVRERFFEKYATSGKPIVSTPRNTTIDQKPNSPISPSETAHGNRNATSRSKMMNRIATR